MIYQSKVVGDGSTMENARKPEISGEVSWLLIEDLGDYMIVQSDEVDLGKFINTWEL